MIGPGRMIGAWVLAATLAAAAQEPAPAPAKPSPDSQGFWTAISKLGFIFKAVGSLSGGVDQGRVWIVDLSTGEQHPVAAADALAWPVLAPDDRTVFALSAGRIVRLSARGGDVVPLGAHTGWSKLVAVDAQSNVLGFVAGQPRVHPALMTAGGELHLLPQPATEEERERVSLLLQENRAYADDRQLIVKRSTRGGRGYDVSLVSGGQAKTLSDCGDDLCGQPSLSADRRYVLYVRAPPP